MPPALTGGLATHTASRGKNYEFTYNLKGRLAFLLPLLYAPPAAGVRNFLNQESVPTPTLT